MNTNKQLIVDTILFNPQQQINEINKNNNKIKPNLLTVTGTVQRAGEVNQNGRVYPRSVLEREIERYKKTYVAQRRALGELDHPEHSVVMLGNSSHNIADLWWDGDEVKAKIEILTTPSGNILRELFKNNVQLGISSRGMGSVQESDDGILEVQDDFELICWDFVSNPSTQGAFMEKVVNESKNYNENYCNNKINSLINDILKNLS